VATSDNYTNMDVGVAGDRYFANVLAMGMMVDVSQKTDQFAKNTMGVMAYYLRTVAELPNLRPIPISIKSAGKDDIETSMTAMLVMNGSSAGGFRHVAPEASVNDGHLDVVLFHKMPFANLGPLLMSVWFGQHTDNKYVTYFRTDEMRIESTEEIITDVDGETGDPLPLDVKVLPERIRVCTRESNMTVRAW